MRALPKIGSCDDGTPLDIPKLSGLGQAERLVRPSTDIEKDAGHRETPFDLGEAEIQRFALSREELLSIYGPVDHRHKMPPVRNQFESQACVAFSVAAVAEQKALNEEKNIEIATGWLHHCVGGQPLNKVISINQLVNGLRGRMVPLVDADGPYWCSVECEREKKFLFPSLGWCKGEGPMMDMLGQGSVVATGMTFDKGFFDGEGPETYELTPGLEQYEHYICLVGFTKTHWICRNSYGADWRVGGYFYVRFGDCAIGEYTSCGWANPQYFRARSTNVFS